MRIDEAAALVASRIATLPALSGRRRLIALAGPPASGKSTLAERLVETLPDAAMVPMDGFHLDNRLLDARGLRQRKGAPETFDVAGFRHLLTRLRDEAEVIYPLFDRSLDCAIAGAGQVDGTVRTVVVEGNYLLLDAPGWRDLHPLWDFSAYLSVPQAELRQRLMARWRGHGYSDEEAARKTDTNDLPNAATTARLLCPPDLRIDESPQAE